MSLVRKVGIRAPDGGVITQPKWRVIVKELLSTELLIETNKYLSCNPKVLELITRSCRKGTRLTQWFKAVESLTYSEGYKITKLWPLLL